METRREGKVWARPVLVVLALVVWAALSWADTLAPTGIGQLMTSTINGAVVAPIVGVIPRGGDPSNAQEGNVWSTTARNALRTLPPGWTAAQGFAQVLSTNTVSSTAVANPTVNTSFTTTFAVPANALTAGKKLRIYASGQYTTGAATAGNLSFTGELGPSGQALATTGNVSTTSGASALGWTVEQSVIVHSTGVFGVVASNIRGTVENAQGVTDSFGIGRIQRVVNTTGVNTIALEVMISASDASCSVTLEELTVEQLN